MQILVAEFSLLVVLLVSACSQSSPPELATGEQSYVEHCQQCHEGKVAKAPPRSLLGIMSASPVYPGETIRTLIWEQRPEICFRSHCLERDVVILNNGSATLDKS